MRRPVAAAVSLMFALACGDAAPDMVPDAAAAMGGASATAVEPPSATAGSAAADPGTATVGDDAPRVVFVGTSLTAGYGLADPTTEAWPAVVGDLARKAGSPIRVVNAGVSGDTSAGGLRRIVPLLNPLPTAVVLELGANDGLRGLPVQDLRANLDAAVDSILRYAPGAHILVVGMEAPRNLGAEYVDAFTAVYDGVQARPDVSPVPFLLEEVAGIAELNQPDGIHPVAEGHRMIAELVWPYLDAVLRTPAGRP